MILIDTNIASTEGFDFGPEVVLGVVSQSERPRRFLISEVFARLLASEEFFGQYCIQSVKRLLERCHLEPEPGNAEVGEENPPLPSRGRAKFDWSQCS